MKGTIGMHMAEDYCHHLCPNPGCSYKFKDVDRQAWGTVKDETCPECGSSRFKYQAGRLVPCKTCAASWLHGEYFNAGTKMLF